MYTILLKGIFEQTIVLTNEITSTLHKTAAKHAMYLRKEGQQRKEKELWKCPQN